MVILRFALLPEPLKSTRKKKKTAAIFSCFFPPSYNWRDVGNFRRSGTIQRENPIVSIPRLKAQFMVIWFGFRLASPFFIGHFYCNAYGFFFHFFVLFFSFNRWAVSTVMTRQNLIPSQEEISGNDKDQLPPVNALIPLWDFCNHQDGQV